MDSLQRVGSVIGRILLALIFVLGGLTKLPHPAGTAAYMESAGIHTMVLPLAVIAALIELVGGGLLMVGLGTRLVAFILFLYLIPVTIMIHLIPGGQMNQIQVMKNVAIMGGLLVVACSGGRRSMGSATAAA
jgi:putative oxidoreductase